MVGCAVPAGGRRPSSPPADGFGQGTERPDNKKRNVVRGRQVLTMPKGLRPLAPGVGVDGRYAVQAMLALRLGADQAEACLGVFRFRGVTGFLGDKPYPRRGRPLSVLLLIGSVRGRLLPSRLRCCRLFLCLALGSQAGALRSDRTPASMLSGSWLVRPALMPPAAACGMLPASGPLRLSGAGAARAATAGGSIRRCGRPRPGPGGGRGCPG